MAAALENKEKSIQVLFKGFRFGMLLQFAVGPVCLFVFQTAILKGFWVAETGVLGAALADALEILLAVLGLGVLSGKHCRTKTFMKIFGALILFFFGASFILNAFDMKVLPAIAVGSSDAGINNIFLPTLAITLSNPLTAVFWIGIFSAKATQENISKSNLKFYGAGCVLSTLFFLSLVAIAGTLVQKIIPFYVISVLNAAVGLLLIYFGIKTFMAKEESNVVPAA